MFSDNDITQIQDKGLNGDKVLGQIELFRQGIPFVNLHSAATLNDGVLKLSDKQKQDYIDLFDIRRNDNSILKFVPASGAATRMFKVLFNFVKQYNPEKETLNAYINREKESNLSLFFVGIEQFPFYEGVQTEMQKYYPNFKTFSTDEECFYFVKTMLDSEKLNYGFFPKGLLPFHQYKGHVATAFEEHLFEAALYASSNNKAYLHFTISERYMHIFDSEFKRIQDIVERKTNTIFHISFSYQKESTDTIAVTPENKPFRLDDDSLLFRPSGHGALLQNLNEQEADIIFIKNIDNVVVYKYEQEVADYKKALAGLLVSLQNKMFEYLNQLDYDNVSENDLIEIAEFLSNQLNTRISKEFEKYSLKYQVEYLRNKLNRPIRVCGMVKNEGEPGGGPFWVKGESGQVSLQIVESAQINKKDGRQKNILRNATHFNPVDLICGIKDYKGNTFNLENFVDSKTAFITMKTKMGKDVKALELPGLWNGSMAHWNTIFVEVPLMTFNPVKTVTDLLKPTHQIK